MRKMPIAAALVLALLATASGELRAYSPKRTTLMYVEIGAADLMVNFGNLTVKIGEPIDPDAVMAELGRLELSFEVNEETFTNLPDELPALAIEGFGFRIVYLAESKMLVGVTTKKKDWRFGNGLNPGDSVEELRRRFPELPDDSEGILDCLSPPFNECMDLVSGTGFFFWLAVYFREGVVEQISVRLSEFAV